MKINLPGKTYKEKQQALRQFAINYQNMISDQNLSYGELLYFEDLFEKYGKRYGLLKEFHENGIC